MSKRSEALRDMGYMAHLIVRLLEIGGPMTTTQMRMWIHDPDKSDSALGVANVVSQMEEKGILEHGGASLWRLTDERKPVADDDEPILMSLDLLDRNSASFAGDPGNHLTISRNLWRESGFPITVAVRPHALETK